MCFLLLSSVLRLIGIEIIISFLLLLLFFYMGTIEKDPFLGSI